MIHRLQSLVLQRKTKRLVLETVSSPLLHPRDPNQNRINYRLIHIVFSP